MIDINARTAWRDILDPKEFVEALVSGATKTIPAQGLIDKEDLVDIIKTSVEAGIAWQGSLAERILERGDNQL